MPSSKKSWNQKLADSKGLPKVFAVEGKMLGRWNTKPGDTCVIPSPLEVDALMKKIPKGKLATIHELRAALAKKHHTTIACPITTGIFTWIAAHAAHESQSKKQPRITPYWRTLKSNGQLNPKFPGGIPNLKKHLTAEGHKITRKDKTISSPTTKPPSSPSPEKNTLPQINPLPHPKSLGIAIGFPVLPTPRQHATARTTNPSNTPQSQ